MSSRRDSAHCSCCEVRGAASRGATNDRARPPPVAAGHRVSIISDIFEGFEVRENNTMTPVIRYNAFFFLALGALLSLACVTGGTAKAGGYYEYFEDDFNTPDVSEEWPGDGEYAWKTEHAEAGGGSAHAECDAGGGASISSGGLDRYKSASISAGSYADSTIGYQWYADPGDPNEVPPGGTFSYSVSASGSAHASGESWLSGSALFFSGSCEGSGYSTFGGSGSPGGGAGDSAWVDGSAQNNSYGSVSWYPQNHGSGQAGAGWFYGNVGWSVNDSESGINVQEGTGSVSGTAAAGASAGGGGSGYWNGSGEGSAGGDASGGADADAHVTIGFSSN